MEFFNTILSFASMAVAGFGGGVAISGLMAIGEGKFGTKVTGYMVGYKLRIFLIHKECMQDSSCPWSL